MNGPKARTGWCIEGRSIGILNLSERYRLEVWNETSRSLKIYGQSSLHLDYIIQTYQSDSLMVILQEYISNVIFIIVKLW